VLMYHQVMPDPPAAFRKYAVTPAAFARQMAWLAAAGYAPVSLDALADAHAGRATLPTRAVVITFDDGFQGCADHAAPVLARHGFTAAFYLVAGLLGATSRWLAAERGVEFPLMGWAAARGLEAAGMRCEAHSLTHPRLASLGRDACAEELRRSRALLEDGLGRPVRHLAYPFGSYSVGVRALAAEAGYLTACTVEERLAVPGDDPLALPRVPVTGHDTLVDFACRLRAVHSARELARGAARRAWRRVRPR